MRFEIKMFIKNIWILFQRIYFIKKLNIFLFLRN